MLGVFPVLIRPTEETDDPLATGRQWRAGKQAITEVVVENCARDRLHQDIAVGVDLLGKRQLYFERQRRIDRTRMGMPAGRRARAAMSPPFCCSAVRIVATTGCPATREAQSARAMRAAGFEPATRGVARRRSIR
jgi:hypothetical protein